MSDVSSPASPAHTSASPGAHEPVHASRRGLHTQLRFALSLILVSLMSAAFAIAFRSALHGCFRLAARSDDVVSAMTLAPTWIRVLLPALGGLLAGCVGLYVSRFPASHGVADVMEAVVLGRVRLTLGVTLLKSLASWFAIVTGGSLGREGPLIQFGGAIGHFVGRRLGLTLVDARRLIAAGTAAGFTAAYNTPFAAVLFVIEVVTGVVVLDTVVPVLVATVLAAQTTRILAGEGPIYGLRVFTLVSPLELVAFAGIGVLGALAAQCFMRLLSWAEDALARPSLPLPFRPALGGLAAGVLIAFIPQVAGNGYEPLNELLSGRFSVAFIGLLLACKVVATTASVSSGSPGGVFTPILLLGGGLGYAVGVGLAHTAGSAVGPAGGYALVGMAATTAASTHAPLMAAVMAFELSGDYAIVLPLILATGISTALSRKLRAESIYGAELKEKGIAWELTMEGRRVARLHDERASRGSLSPPERSLDP